MTHTLAAHELGTQYVNTGNRPIASLEYPSYGSVVTKELPGRRDLPPFVAIPNTPQRTGFLGVQYSALSTSDSSASRASPIGVRGISLGNGLTVADVEKRQHLLADLDTTFRRVDTNSTLLDGLDRFGRQAYEIITSQRARDAFDVSKESPAFCRTVRQDAVRHELPVGDAAGRGRRAVRDHHLRRLGHALRQLERAAKKQLPPLGRRAQPRWPTAWSRRACWIRPRS